MYLEVSEWEVKIVKAILRVMAMLLLFTNAFAGWNVVKIATCPTTWCWQIKVAPGRNDGVNRVYLVTSQGSIHEWTYSGGSWGYQTVYYSSAETYMPLTVGAGRNDGLNRLYTGEPIPGGKIREATFSGGWTSGIVQSTVGNVQGIKVGDGRNDGVMRLYVAGLFGLYEYTWMGNWIKQTIDNATIGEIDIGAGRNDGKNRIYAPVISGPLYEFTWNINTFNKVVINPPQQGLAAVAVGPGRNDNINRAYASKSDGHLYEFSYISSAWQQPLDVTPSGPDRTRFGIQVSRTRSDGKYRVYATIQGGTLYEYSWDGSSFKDSIVDAVSGATRGFDIGVGRNDDTVRIYTTNWLTNGIYEITNTSPYYGVAEETTNHKPQTAKLSAYPNPFTRYTIIRFQIPDSKLWTRDLRLTIYDLVGKLIKAWDLGCGDCSFREVVWDGRNAARNKIPSGIYFYRLEGKGFNVSKKLILL